MRGNTKSWRNPGMILDQSNARGSVAVRRSTMTCGTTRTTESSMKTLNPAVARVLKRAHYPRDVILTCVRWYVPSAEPASS
jgi:hypothetical protein